jgi:hypothetical protein
MNNETRARTASAWEKARAGLVPVLKRYHRGGCRNDPVGSAVDERRCHVVSVLKNLPDMSPASLSQLWDETELYARTEVLNASEWVPGDTSPIW